ncbi:hypothetical protein [Alloactinosynnema sp. L-07]|uniref:hypothetical protein n=1 Tax=Alloactinosynnema sp. L-07 TaxID=1653480 RepID=UPI00065EF69D|nr:hypothetical protein [Alloactinosynnema sp. L-07]CRK60557.1 hypothetical protein [Alloactinosynnema sp. L-07]
MTPETSASERALAEVLRSYFASPPDSPAALHDALEGVRATRIRRALDPWPGFNREWARYTGRWLVCHGTYDPAVWLGLALLGATGTTEDADLIRTAACVRRFTRPAIEALSAIGDTDQDLLWLADRIDRPCLIWLLGALCAQRLVADSAGCPAAISCYEAVSAHLEDIEPTFVRYAAVVSLVEELISGRSLHLDWADGQRQSVITRSRAVLASAAWQESLRQAKNSPDATVRWRADWASHLPPRDPPSGVRLARLIRSAVAADPTLLGRWGYVVDWISSLPGERDQVRFTFRSASDPDVQSQWLIDVNDHPPEVQAEAFLRALKFVDPRTLA